ncbi:hypothetical protein [Pediococcus pentosaceus]|uniref:hypothetical protein n=1 Tax=Pediococcus pentosaceus TaxID=1255 RepID=UPI003982CD27
MRKRLDDSLAILTTGCLIMNIIIDPQPINLVNMGALLVLILALFSHLIAQYLNSHVEYPGKVQYGWWVASVSFQGLAILVTVYQVIQLSLKN